MNSIAYNQPSGGILQTNATASVGSVTIAGTEQSIVQQDCEYVGSVRRCTRANTLYDTGTITLTANGHSNSVAYASASTPTTLATALGSAINADSSAYITASTSGAVVTLTSKITGTASNYSISVLSQTSDTPDFGISSFSAALSGSTLSGGANAVYSYGAVYAATMNHAADGSITSSTDSVNGNGSYRYDPFNRLPPASA